MRPVFDFLDCRDVLKEAYEEKKASVPHFSYRMMGDRLEIDGSYLYRILQKELHLPTRCLPRAIELLGLTGRSAEYYQLLAAYQRERGTKARQDILEKALSLRDVERSRLQENELAFFNNWWVVAVRCLIEVVHGRAHPAELAARIEPRITEDEAKQALELLTDLGLVKNGNSGRLVLAQTHLTASGPDKNLAVQSFQKNMLRLAEESFDRFPKEQRNVSTLSVAIDDQAWREIKEMLRECRRQIQKRVEDANQPDRVMQIVMASFPLAPELAK